MFDAFKGYMELKKTEVTDFKGDAKDLLLLLEQSRLEANVFNRSEK